MAGYNEPATPFFMSGSWILIGMMGAGKSSVGRALAELSGREFHDTDLLLQARFGRPVSQIFAVYGESTFRDHETSVLKGLEPNDVVLATGGGIVMRNCNWDEFRRLGTTIYLQAEFETLAERLSKSKKKRPLLECEDWQARLTSLLEARRELYEQADVTVSVDGIDVCEAAERAYQAVRSR